MSAKSSVSTAARTAQHRREGWMVGGFGASAVVLGAAGAHLLQGMLPVPMLAVWHTAVQYQFWHALALALAVYAAPACGARRVACTSYALGILLFSGSLYALALGAPRWVGIITPFGGVALIIGWLALGFAWYTAGRQPLPQ